MSGFFSGSFDPTWPHVILLAVAIFASLAVALGIVLESPKWSLANVLVVGGVAIEAVCTVLLFGFDEGISRAQERTIESLNTQLILSQIGRGIDPAALANAVKPLPKASFEILYDEHVADTRTLAKLIWSGLKQAEWSPIQKDGPTPIGSSFADLALKGFAGGIVVFGTKWMPVAPALPAYKLELALSELILPRGSTGVSGRSIADMPDNTYRIIVGSRS